MIDILEIILIYILGMILAKVLIELIYYYDPPTEKDKESAFTMGILEAARDLFPVFSWITVMFEIIAIIIYFIYFKLVIKISNFIVSIITKHK